MHKIQYLLLFLLVCFCATPSAQASYVPDESHPLITKVEQFSSPYSDPGEGNFYSLIDKLDECPDDQHPSNDFWHSNWHNGAQTPGTHYFQVDMSNVQMPDDYSGNIVFVYTRRSTADNDQTTKWSVRGTNNVNAEKADCEELLQAETPFTSKTETLTSEPFSTKGYKYLRFYSEEQYPSSRGYFHVARFQLYPAVSAKSPYAVLSNNNKVLTFYYDDQKETRGGMSVGPFSLSSDRDWDDLRSTITTVVFDPSFANCTSLTSTAYWFHELSKLTTITSIENLKTDNVIDMGRMFSGCSSLTSLDVSGFKTDNVIDMAGMFYGCSKLTSLDVSGFNTNKVTEMGIMFYGCSNLTNLDVSGFKTDNVTNMSLMFCFCSTLTILDLSGFKTDNVTTMGSMFSSCPKLTNLNLSGFKTSKVTDMSYMFAGCSNLGTIYVGDEWTTTKVTVGNDMFIDCTQLVGSQGTAYNSSHTDYTYAHVDGGTSNPGYLSAVDTEPSPYAVLSNNNTVLTFYYDDQKVNKGGMSVGSYSSSSYPGWHNQRSTITTVVFDASFASCSSLTSTAYWFYQLSKITAITGISNLKTDNVTDMGYMFSGCSSLTSLDLSSFKTDNVINMHSMFRGCSNLTSLDVSGIKTDNVTSMRYMFYGNSSLTSLNLSAFKTDNVTDMGYMFTNCSNLTSLDLNSFQTDNVTSMNRMFYGCSKLGTIDVGNGWTTEKVTSGSDMFTNCSQLVGSQGTTYNSSHTDHTYAHVDGGTSNPGYLSGVNTEPLPYAVLSNNSTVLTFYYDNQKETRGGVGLFNYTESSWYNQRDSIITVVFDTSFANYTSLTSTAYWFVQLSKLTAITGIENLKTDNVTSMAGMFFGCYNLTTLDVSGFKTENVTNMSYMFDGCSRLTNLNVSGFKTDNVLDMRYMFMGCSNLTNLDVSGFKTDNVTDMRYMFYGCPNLTSLDVSGFKTDNVTNMTGMFSGCSNLTSLDVSGFKTNNVTDMGEMFGSCPNLTSVDVSGFKTDNVTNMTGMFSGCSNLTSLDVSGFKTDNVTTMQSMFSSCSNLTSLDVSSFKTDNVTDMSYMFFGCSNLGNIYAGGGWTTTKVTNGGYMFFNCTQLVGGQGTTYNSSYTDHTYAHIDGGTSNPGYLSAVDTVGTFVDNNVSFKVTSQAAEKTVTYVQGPSAEEITVPADVYYNGQTYAVTALADSAFAGQPQLKSVFIPSSITAVGKNLFVGSPHVAAITWEAPIKMTQEMAGSVANNPNLLFFTDNASHAPDGVTNIINSQTMQAERIVLSDANENNDFYCPEEFMVGSISYSHAYQLFTVTGQCQGWESLVLPFDVTEITHEKNGVITPFGALQRGREFDNGTKPFWLYSYTTNGTFAEAENIRANVSYILSMPNEAKFTDEYILAGNITFKGTNAIVNKTSNAKAVKSGYYSFTPSYQNGSSASVYLLNVDQSYDGNPKGSVFIKNNLLERQARPFEAYFQLSGSAGVKSFISIFDALTDGIKSMEPAKRNSDVEYYQLDGTKRTSPQRGFNIIRTKDKVRKVIKK